MDPVFFLPLSSSRLACPALGTHCSAFSGPPRSPEPFCWTAQRAVPFGPECLLLEAAPLLPSPCLGLALQVSPTFSTRHSLSLSVSLLWVLGNHLLPSLGSSLLLVQVVPPHVTGLTQFRKEDACAHMTGGPFPQCVASAQRGGHRGPYQPVSPPSLPCSCYFPACSRWPWVRPCSLSGCSHSDVAKTQEQWPNSNSLQPGALVSGLGRIFFYLAKDGS